MGRLLATIELVEHKDQRYPTAGDWYRDKEGILRVLVSDTGVSTDAMLIGLHELVEAVLCVEHGVREEDVTEFDVAFEKTHDLSEEEPGESPFAPYRREHAAADVVERLVALEADHIWKDYCERVDSLFGEPR